MENSEGKPVASSQLGDFSRIPRLRGLHRKDETVLPQILLLLSHPFL